MAPPKKGNFNNKKGSNGALGKKSLPKEKSIDELYGKSDIDAFTDKKNKVDLNLFQKKGDNKKKATKKEEITLDYSDEEVEDFEDDSFEDDGIDDDDQEDDEILETKTKKKNLDLENKLSWGTDKKSFYGKQIDDQNAIPSDEEEEEEAEAKELQKQREKTIHDEDFEDEQSFKKLVNKKTNNDKSSKSKTEDKILNSMNKDLDSINFGSKGVEIEKLEKNISNFTKQEKLKYLISESPLLLELLEEFKVKIAEIKTTILPILEKVKNNQIPTSKGISFLETKYHLLLSYCLNITYFLMIKSSGVSIKDHPVVDQLVKIRVMIEKMKPLDKKLKYQIEKLLKNASTGTIGVSEDDPLRFKPNLGSLKKSSKRQQDDSDDDQDQDDQEQSQMLSNAGIYQAPKYGSRGGIIDEEDKISRQKEKKKRDQIKATKSNMAQFIQEQYGDTPLEESDFIDGSNKPIEEELERKRYEEDNFTRLLVSKKDRKLEAQKKKKLSDGLDDIGDFNDLSGLMDDEDREEKENKKYLANKRMAMMMNNLSQIGKNKRPRGAEDELLADTNNNRRQQQQQMDYDDDVPSGGDDDDDDAPFQYDGIPRAEGDDENEYTRDAKVGEKRKISKKIDDNRGLTRIRNPEYKTPHLRNRAKYTKALKKRNNLIQKGDRKDTSYKGVKSINTRAVKAQPYL
ncbi:hypothetical protein CYY_009430 [Polysphondylium violaceum]|uniref:Sas10 C-terminal domain-containing protein n=1 Tax=Polysphondylium violaceum TaxID=133409 RepID=A0A8J4PTP0_9MYCE|nr:hypothetical protein CYY_009430 [Polysphondylium violaceum]